MSLRDRILAEFKPAIRAVEIEGAEPVWIRSLDADGIASILGLDSNIDRAVAGVLASLCEEDGTLIFAGGEEELVRKLDWRFLNAVADAAMEFNGLIDDEDDPESLAGKSETTPAGDSPSA